VTRAAWLLVLLGALLVAAGCDPLRAATVAANAAARTLVTTQTAMAGEYRAAQIAAAKRVQGDRSDPTVRAEVQDRAQMVRSAWETAWGTYHAAYSAWAILVAAIHAAERGETPVDFAALAADLASRMGELAEVHP